MCGILFGREPRVSLSHVYMEAFELATSFLANMFAVVLIGLVLTETFPYVMTCLRARGRARTDQKNACIRRVLLDHLILFFLVAYAGGVTIYATLVPAFGVHYDVQWIHASVLFVLFALLSYWRDRKSTRLNSSHSSISYAVFFFNDTATTEIYPLSLHDALPICLLLEYTTTFSGYTRVSFSCSLRFFHTG